MPPIYEIYNFVVQGITSPCLKPGTGPYKIAVLCDEILEYTSTHDIINSNHRFRFKFYFHQTLPWPSYPIRTGCLAEECILYTCIILVAVFQLSAAHALLVVPHLNKGRLQYKRRTSIPDVLGRNSRPDITDIEIYNTVMQAWAKLVSSLPFYVIC